MPRRWYVATTRPLQQELADRSLRQLGFHTFNPRVRVRVPKPDGTMRYKIQPYIAGYIFIRFDAVKDDWSTIRGTRGVGFLLARDELPCRIRRGVVECMVAEYSTSGYAVDERRLDEMIIHTGDSVEILGGAFVGLKPVVLDSPHTKVSFMLEMFGRSVEASANRDSLRIAKETT